MRAYLAGLALFALLTACSGAAERTETPADRREPGSAASDAGPAGPAPAETSANLPLPRTLSANDLPLREGVYARVDSTNEAPLCPPPLATIATFDGQGFGGRNSTDCRFDPTQKNGPVWSGTQTCADTYSQERRTEDWTITVDSPTRYTQENRFGAATFALCPDEALSDWIG